MRPVMTGSKSLMMLTLSLPVLAACERSLDPTSAPEFHYDPGGGAVVLAGSGTATIDGLLSPGEWEGAGQVPVFVGDLAGSILYAMNDEDYLYLALRIVGNADLSSADQMVVRFDNAHNGVVDVGDDQVGASPAGPGGGTNFGDAHYDASAWGWGTPDTQFDGDAAAMRDGTTDVYEIAHPLNSGDPNDFALASGDVVGLCVWFFLDGIGTSDAMFPLHCVYGGPDQTGYADIAITSPVMPIAIDIKPGSDPNSINVRSGGKLSVAVLTTAEFDATTVRPETVTLGDGEGDDTPVAAKNNGKFWAALKDVDDDGDVDLILHFGIEPLIENGDLDPGSLELVLRGATADGTKIEGADAVVVVG